MQFWSYVNTRRNIFSKEVIASLAQDIKPNSVLYLSVFEVNLLTSSGHQQWMQLSDMTKSMIGLRSKLQNLFWRTALEKKSTKISGKRRQMLINPTLHLIPLSKLLKCRFLKTPDSVQTLFKCTSRKKGLMGLRSFTFSSKVKPHTNLSDLSEKLHSF